MSSFSEQEMRAYLLGELSSERHTELAAVIHSDAELQEELLAIEEELFDQYLAGSFSTDEQEYFKTHFLNSEGGQRKLHFARLFREYRDRDLREGSITEDRAPAPIPPLPAPSPWFVSFHQNPAYAASLIVIAGLLATLIGWVYVKKSPTMQTTAAKIPALTLSAGSNLPGSSIKKLRTPAQNDEVKVELELTKSDFKKYKAQLFRENQALALQEELPIVSRNAHYVVPVTVTGNLLTPGDYQLKLCGVPDSGQPTYIDVYSFRVTDETASDPDQEQNRIAR